MAVFIQQSVRNKNYFLMIQLNSRYAQTFLYDNTNSTTHQQPTLSSNNFMPKKTCGPLSEYNFNSQYLKPNREEILDSDLKSRPVSGLKKEERSSLLSSTNNIQGGVKDSATVYLAKHKKRNEAIRERIQHQTPRYSFYGYDKDTFERKRSFQREENKFRQKDMIDFEGFQDKDAYQTRRNNQPYQPSCFNAQRPSNSILFNSLQQKKQNGEQKYHCWSSSFRNNQFSKGDISQQYRFESQQTSRLQTPSKNTLPLEQLPGTAERKKSLLQKSQELQLKLKKMNSSSNVASPFNQSTSSPAQNNFNHPSYSKRMNLNICGEAEERIASIKKNKQNQVIYSPLQIKETSTEVYRGEDLNQRYNCSKNEERLNVNDKSSAYGKNDSQSENNVIDKISRLNQKINQRIQSIISTYTNN